MIEFAEARGYRLEMSIPGQFSPTLVFDRVGGADPSWVAPTDPAGRTWGATTQADVAATASPKWKKALRVLAWIALSAFVYFAFSMCARASSKSGGSSSSSRVNARLHESTAEVACEREVRDRLAGSPTFKPGANWEIDGGWAINGRATTDGGRLGYSCEVIGPEGSHKVKVVGLG
ncbi:hypothetical protein IPV09_11830 [Tessaracoccus sp. SD287]|uniref:hypothetical protein n=1 Tax=Tessaracoccus sp. SD287 TaxID=2782008 RepID=UPI001A974832|nr:hypothetical protein [Tessaracoccus sp. SD287]MBO1032026.1 hypothetical protein [Tessaracoccus sp. SD287]